MACGSEVLDLSSLNWTRCWLNLEDFVLLVLGNMKKETEHETRGGKKALGRDVESILLLSCSVSLAILCACALILQH